MYTVSAPIAPPSLPINHLQINRLQIDHFEVLPWFWLTMSSKCICKHAQLRPPSASGISLNQGLKDCTIMGSKCISKLAQLWPPSASWSSLALGHQVHLPTCLVMTSKCILWVHLLLASKCISKLAQSWPPSTSLSAHNHSVVIQWSSCWIERKFVRNSCSGSSSIGTGWENMKAYPAMRNHTKCVDLWKLS